MISTASIAIQFGEKPLFEHISVKFGEGNRYGLIGAVRIRYAAKNIVLEMGFEPANACATGLPQLKFDRQTIRIQRVEDGKM